MSHGPRDIPERGRIKDVFEKQIFKKQKLDDKISKNQRAQKYRLDTHVLKFAYSDMCTCTGYTIPTNTLYALTHENDF